MKWILIFYMTTGPHPQPELMDQAACEALLTRTRLPAACQVVDRPDMLKVNRLRQQQLARRGMV